MKALCLVLSLTSIAVNLCTGSASGVVVINELFVGGGTTNAITLYRKDYIELFNTGTASVDLSGYKLEYASAANVFTGSATNSFTLPAGTIIGANNYLLIATATAGAAGEEFEADITTGTLSLSAAAGKVRLVSSTFQGANNAVSGEGIIDFVGYGPNASLWEGMPGPGPALTGTGTDTLTNSLQRNIEHLDTNNNAADFFVALPSLTRASGVTPPTSLLGDANNDGVVDVFDFDAISQNFGNTGGPSDGTLLGDANDDGVVDVFDFDATSQNFGNTALAVSDGAVPEPASIVTLLVVGVAAGIALKRRC